MTMMKAINYNLRCYYTFILSYDLPDLFEYTYIYNFFFLKILCWHSMLIANVISIYSQIKCPVHYLRNNVPNLQLGFHSDILMTF